MFAEAMLLHHLDNLDSKMEAIRQVIKRDSSTENEFTGWVPSLERQLLHKDRYLLAEGQPSIVAEPSQVYANDATQEQPAAAAQTPPQPVTPPKPQPVAHIPRPAKPVTNNLFGDKLQAALTRDE
jgi:3'-5' exoribonuclease